MVLQRPYHLEESILRQLVAVAKNAYSPVARDRVAFNILDVPMFRSDQY